MAGLQPNVYAAILATMPAAAAALVLRLVARRMIQMKYWWDDLFAVLGYIFTLGYCIDVLIWTADWSLGLFIAAPGDPEADLIREKSRLLLWFEELFYTLSLGCSKLSILSFYWRIFQHTSIRIPIQILLVAATLWMLIKAGMTIFQCWPVRYAWNKSIGGYCGLNMSTFFFGTIICHVAMDVIILLLPVFPVAKMHMSLGKKLAVTTIFHSGVIVCIASVFVLVESWKYDQHTIHPQYDSALFSAWAAVEVNLAVFAGCLPMLKPIFRKLFPHVDGMSSEGDSIQDERHSPPSGAFRFGRSDKKKSNAGLHTLQAPVHREHAASRPSAVQQRDIERQDPDHDLWDDADIADDGYSLQNGTAFELQPGKGSPTTPT